MVHALRNAVWMMVAVSIFHPEVLTTVDSAIRVDLDDMGKTTRVAPGGDSTWVWKTSKSIDFAKFREAFFGVLVSGEKR